MLVAIAAITAASLITVLVVMPEGIVLSADPGAPTHPLWTVLLPPIAVIALMFVLPHPGKLPVTVVDHGRARASTLVVLACVIAFAVIVALPGVSGTGLYALAKGLVLIAIPATLVSLLQPAVDIARSRSAAQVWVPLVLIAVWALLAKAAPWHPSYDYGGFDPVMLLVGGLITALTAGVGEELVYRRWLQTRLEAFLGAWPGIALASLLFAWVHLGTHGSGNLPLDAAVAIVAQGTSGLMLGIMWWRYRLLWPLIVIHILMNGWEIVPALLS